METCSRNPQCLQHHLVRQTMLKLVRSISTFFEEKCLLPLPLSDLMKLHLVYLALLQPLMQFLFDLPKTVPRYFRPRQQCSFHIGIQMFTTTNCCWKSRLTVQVDRRCVLQLFQHPYLHLADASRDAFA